MRTFALSLAVLLSACGDSSTATFTDDEGNTVRVNSGTGGGGDIAGASDFDDVPRFPGTVIQAFVQSDDGQYLHYMGSGSFADAVAHFERELPGRGWTRESGGTYGGPEGQTNATDWTRQDARLSVAVSDAGGQLMIQVRRASQP